MPETLLIKNATCVLPKATVKQDVLIEGTTIARIGVPAGTRADQVVDGTDLHLIPGVIDDQVHFRDPGFPHKEDLRTGSMACAKGGVTTFLEMPNTEPATTSQRQLNAKLDLASRKSVVNYGFFIGATANNIQELQHAERTAGIKIFVGSSTGSLLVDDQPTLERIFAETTLPICAHCEDESTIRANREALGPVHDYADHSRIRDQAAALTATRRMLALAFEHKRRFHVLHVSTAAEADVLGNHRRIVTCEVCPHHLYFSTDDYARLGSWIQVNPSVKSPEDTKGLWQALADGRIQVIASDHAPHTQEEKRQPYPKSPSGIPSVENTLALMLDAVNHGRLTLEQVVHCMCDAPARVWDIVGKGRIQEGYDADLVLVDMKKKATIRNQEQATKSKWSPWNGVTLTGWPVRTWVMGRLVCSDGRFHDDRPGSEAKFDHARGGYWATEE